MPSDIVITFETLYDLLRREKNKEEIQPLELTFFTDVLAYLAEKQALLATKTDDDLFTMGEREKIETELKNIKKILRELYERREKKIIDLAINKSRTASGIIQTSHLLPGEHALFTTLVTTLDAWREHTLANLFGGHQPTIPLPSGPTNSTLSAAPKTTQVITTPSATTAPQTNSALTPPTNSPRPTPLTPSPPEKKTQHSADPATPSLTKSPSPLSTSPAATTSEAKLPLHTLTITHPIPQFLGENLETYGPYRSGDVAHLPERLANVLLTKKRAEPLLQVPIQHE